MKEARLPLEVRQAHGLVGIKNTTPRRARVRWLVRHTKTQRFQYTNPARVFLKKSRAIRKAARKAYEKQFLR